MVPDGNRLTMVALPAQVAERQGKKVCGLLSLGYSGYGARLHAAADSDHSQHHQQDLEYGPDYETFVSTPGRASAL